MKKAPWLKELVRLILEIKGRNKDTHMQKMVLAHVYDASWKSTILNKNFPSAE